MKGVKLIITLYDPEAIAAILAHPPRQRGRVIEQALRLLAERTGPDQERAPAPVEPVRPVRRSLKPAPRLHPTPWDDAAAPRSSLATTNVTTKEDVS
jgi:hypothetical protein